MDGCAAEVMEFTETKVILEKESKEECVADSLRELLDDVEDQIEKVRNDALQLLEEKEDIQTTLEMLVGQNQLNDLSVVEREEVEATVERLSSRLNAVNINVSTSRSTSQQESLHSVNKAIDSLIFEIQTDTMKAGLICRQYLSATGTETTSVTDAKFEQHLLGCTVDDQKSVKKRLLGLHEHIKAIACDSIEETK